EGCEVCQNPQEQIREFQVGLARTSARWSRQSWAGSNDRQNLFKIGGIPSWIQYADIPTAPHSRQPMQFLMQFDSYLPTTSGGEMLWGSGGMLYVFWDPQTRVSCHFGQWT
ncbi:MAG: DUF1963 domain-containing protein, partial [Rhodobacteraceae bacterium]|nr:DUF1963 domain-containing protein [Paracoccaceae bacterium]